LLVGAGWANLHVLSRAPLLKRAGAELVLVSPEPFRYYSAMASEVLSGRYGLNDFRIDVRALAHACGAQFIPEEVVSLMPARKKVLTSNGRVLAYDLAAFAVGSLPALPQEDVPAEGSFTVQPVRQVIEIRNEIETLFELQAERALSVVVLGGGPSGVEYALNLASLLKERNPEVGWRVQLFEAEPRVLPSWPAHLSRRVQDHLQRGGVQTRCGANVLHVQSGRVVLDQGETVDYDLAVVALGTRIPKFFAQAGMLTDERNSLLVEATLSVRDYPEIFATGDCARVLGKDFPRGGGQALRQGPVLLRNLLARLAGAPLRTYHPLPSPLQILSLGPERAVAVKGGRFWLGRCPLQWKHRLDAGWKRRYRVRPEGRPPQAQPPFP